MKTKDIITVEVILGPEGKCLVVNDRRVAGPKPWGGGQVILSFKTTRAEIETALK